MHSTLYESETREHIIQLYSTSPIKINPRPVILVSPLHLTVLRLYGHHVFRPPPYISLNTILFPFLSLLYRNFSDILQTPRSESYSSPTDSKPFPCITFVLFFLIARYLSVFSAISSKRTDTQAHTRTNLSFM
ncbi:hypothetical protein CRM22_001328 [Opisthorchis felineus]|uniref:Uncharacterized protein n=1 Tax=Opisthorchis felineus TaxID=147828 RepID=A0A4S2MB80_OPIFE|nr:hypothetical protein CRM22_001328 [Opisthorchis felineus]